MEEPTPEYAPELAKSLRVISKKVRILSTIDWPSSVGEEFFRHGCTRLPEFQYPNYNSDEICHAIDDLRPRLAGDHPVLQWLSRTADKLYISAKMLENMGTSEFYFYSAQLFGTPDKLLIDRHTRTLDLAQHMDTVLSEYDEYDLHLGADVEEMDAETFAEELRRLVDKFLGVDAPRVEISDTLSARVTAGRKRIRVRANTQFSELDMRQLLNHEGLIHVGTSINGFEQKNYPILASAHAGTTEVQEGLAVFAEFISGSMDIVRFKRLVNRVIAIDMAINGADFIEVYRYFLGEGADEDQAFENSRRVFRGGLVGGGAPFTKDGVYLNGLLRVHNFMRTAIKLARGDLIRMMFVGKLDIEDIPALASLAAAQEIKPAKILPPWAKDMRFLVSYLAYSSFLNKVKLPGFQSYYDEMLEDVPDLWDFHT